MNGKGDTNRTSDYKKFNTNYDKIQWGKKKRSFKTSWGVGYDVYVKDNPKKKDNTPTIKDLTNR